MSCIASVKSKNRTVPSAKNRVIQGAYEHKVVYVLYFPFDSDTVILASYMTTLNELDVGWIGLSSVLCPTNKV